MTQTINKIDLAKQVPTLVPLPVTVDGQTVADAQDLIQKSAAAGDDIDCPCCGKNVTVLKYNLNDKLASTLTHICTEYRMLNGKHGVQGVKINGNPKTPEWILKDRTYPKLQYWGLISKVEGHKDLWKPTQAGMDFVDGRTQLPLNAICYNGEVIGYAGKQVYFHQLVRRNTRTEG